VGDFYTASVAPPFWKKPQADLSGVKFSAARAEIVAEPDLTHHLLTFQFDATNGTANFNPGVLESPCSDPSTTSF
jgi:hypothetical protein